jgi:C-terminal processing protease CtpA/Prc
MPVYLLTSSHTFSAAEEFAYDLQALRRATVVGEVTGGGAHPTQMRRIDDHFLIGMPYAKAINPITHTNWEGSGVRPDVAVPAAMGLDTVLVLLKSAQR